MQSGSLTLYRIFWEVGKTGNMTRAAESLHVSQPNVSLALKALENQLGVVLCARSKKGITLTKEGSLFFAGIDKAFQALTTAENQLEKMLALDSGSLSISASDTICQYFLLPFIALFTARHPGIRLEITNHTSDETVALLKEGAVDLGFVNLPLTDEDLLFTPCLPITDILVGGAAYRHLASAKETMTEASLAQGRPAISLKSIASLPLIMLEQKSNSRRRLDQYLLTQGITATPFLALGSIDLVIAFVKAGMGLAIIPRELCGHYVDDQTLFYLPLQETLPQRALGMAERKNMPLSHAAAAFKHFVLPPASIA